MVTSTRAKVSTPLRWAQVAHSILIAPLLIFAAINDSYVVQLESGQTIDIAAYYLVLGDVLLWSVFLIFAVQILSIWRLSTVAIWVYAWFGTWLALIALILATSGEFITKQIRNLSSFGQWFLDAFDVNFDVQIATVEVGNAWIFLLVAAISMIAMAIWLFVEKYRHFKRPLGE
jgi:hypothetical protein